MKITFEEKDKNKAEMMLKALDAFCLLWDIDQELRGYQKYGCNLSSKEEIIEHIREMIRVGNLLSLME